MVHALQYGQGMGGRTQEIQREDVQEDERAPYITWSMGYAYLDTAENAARHNDDEAIQCHYLGHRDTWNGSTRWMGP